MPELTRRRRILIRFLAAVIAGALPPAAALGDPVQPWPDVLLIAPLATGWQGSGEIIGRIADDAKASQLETRVELGKAVTGNLTAWAGWVHFANYNPHAANAHEDQAVEQLNWNLGAAGSVRLTTRARLEQRFVSGVAGTSWRWRQQFRAVLPLRGGRSPSAVLWIEPFLSVNRTGAQSHMLDQLRTFAGLTCPVSRRIDLEIGYLNQRIYRPTQTIVNDAVPMIVTVHL